VRNITERDFMKCAIGRVMDDSRGDRVEWVTGYKF